MSRKRDDFFGRTGASSPSVTPSISSRSNYSTSVNPIATDSYSERRLQNSGDMKAIASGERFVGYSSLPNQVYRRSVRRGFQFNLMVVGASGLGKSTFVNNLFYGDFYNADRPGPTKRATKTVTIEKAVVLINEKQIPLRLTMIDTPGFGDAVDNTGCWDPVVKYLEDQFDEQINNESRITRNTINLALTDNRVNACLYFIQPTGHSLKALDIEFLKRIHEKVNVLPVIAKSDTLTREELTAFKQSIMNDLTQNKIRIYDFPDLPGLVDNTERLAEVRKLRECLPFAIVAADTSPNSSVRERVYPWGAVNTEHSEHSDFSALRTLLIRTHLLDLRDVTINQLYENYRSFKMTHIIQQGKFAIKDGKDPMSFMEQERKDFEAKMKRMESDMEQVFEQKVKEKSEKLKQSESDLEKRAEQMSKQIQSERDFLEQEFKKLEMERSVWEAANPDINSHNSSNSLDKTEGKQKTKKKGIF